LIQITSHGIFEFPDKPLPVVRESHAESLK
jgi:hypothetical protein